MQQLMVTSALLKKCYMQECQLIVLMFDRTALIKAAQFNRTDVIRLLLQRVADVHKPNHFGNTLVHLAAIRNSTDAIVLLFKHGASINITNNRGEKPADIALRYNMKTAVRMPEQL